MTAVVTRALARTYGSGAGRSHALGGMDLAVEPGEVYGLLGPNGAGKTTLCRILATVLLPTSGEARVLGRDVVTQAGAVKRTIGVVFGGDRGLYGRLTARRNLRFWGSLYGLSGSALRRRTDALLDRVGLAERADEPVDTYSRGMKQRLHLARGLVGDPRVLILDEPTVGMDPVGARDFRALVGDLRADRRTVLLTTHDMAEAEAVCDRVTLIDNGQILLTAGPREVGRMVSRHERVDAADVPAGTLRLVAELPGVRAVRRVDGRYRVETNSTEATRSVLRCLVEAGVTEISTSRPGLEEVYLHLIGARGMAVRR